MGVHHFNKEKKKKHMLKTDFNHSNNLQNNSGENFAKLHLRVKGCKLLRAILDWKQQKDAALNHHLQVEMKERN